MLQMSARAEVLAVTPRIEFHGDEGRKALTVKLRFKSVSLDLVEAAFVGQLSLFYGSTTESNYPDVEVLELSREVEHTRAVIGGVELADMRVDNVRLRLLAQRVCELTLKLKGVIEEDCVDALHDALLQQTVPVVLEEHAPPLEADEVQEAA